MRKIFYSSLFLCIFLNFEIYGKSKSITLTKEQKELVRQINKEIVSLDFKELSNLRKDFKCRLFDLLYTINDKDVLRKVIIQRVVNTYQESRYDGVNIITSTSKTSLIDILILADNRNLLTKLMDAVKDDPFYLGKLIYTNKNLKKFSPLILSFKFSNIFFAKEILKHSKKYSKLYKHFLIETLKNSNYELIYYFIVFDFFDEFKDIIKLIENSKLLDYSFTSGQIISNNLLLGSIITGKEKFKSLIFDIIKDKKWESNVITHFNNYGYNAFLAEILREGINDKSYSQYKEETFNQENNIHSINKIFNIAKKSSSTLVKILSQKNNLGYNALFISLICFDEKSFDLILEKYLFDKKFFFKMIYDVDKRGNNILMLALEFSKFSKFLKLLKIITR